MNLILQPGNTCRSATLDYLIETRLSALTGRQPIEEAVVRLNDHRDGSPRYQATVLIRVPGPDIHAAACDHTLRVAVQKALDAVEGQVAARQERRAAQRPGRFQLSHAPRPGRGK